MIIRFIKNAKKWQYLLLFVGGILLTLKLLDTLFPLDQLNHPSRFSRIVTDEQGRLLRAFADHNGVWRHPVKLEQVSKNYIQALIEYEDQRFWTHIGIDPSALIRAFIQNIKCGCIVSGGSTLTMQVARIFYPHEKSLGGKISQALRAIQLEWHLSKTQILELYLNNAPFGGTIEGIQAASRTFLDKNANELTDAEAALLTVLPQAPSRYRPDRYPGRAEKQRNKVLARLYTQGVWSKKRIDIAKHETVLAYTPKRPQYAPLLSRALVSAYPNEQVIHSTINLDLQSAIESYAKDRSELLPDKTSMAILIIDNASHEVKAYIGSADFNNKQRFGHVDMIQAIRSPGSTLKPFIYAMAIEDGIIHSHSLLLDTPRYNSTYRPENFNNRFSGPVSTTTALQKSLNLPAVQVLEALGPDNFYGRLKNAGVSLHIPGKPNLSLALGGAGSSLFDLSSLYSALANDGKVVEPKLIKSSSAPINKYLLSKESSWITYKMLSSAPRPDKLHSSVFFRDINPIAWKTGTSFGYRDAWAIGLSKDMTIGVWVGRPDGTPVPGHFGAATASPILFEIFSNLPGSRQVIQTPPDVSLQDICWPLGISASKTAEPLCHKKQRAWIDQMKVPPTLAEPGVENWRPNPYNIWVNPNNNRLVDKNCLVDAPIKKSIAIWPRVSEPWINHKYWFYNQLPKLDPSCQSAPAISIRPLAIGSIENKSKFRLPEGISKLELNLSALGGQGALDWYIDGQFVGSSLQGHAYPITITQKGQHELVVLDEMGDLDRIEFEVF